MARGTLVPPNFRVDVPSEDELVAVGVVWGLSLPLTVFGIFRCVQQTYSQYRRTRRVNLYMFLIWLELISTTLMGGTAWGYVRGVIPPSMWYFLGAVTSTNNLIIMAYEFQVILWIVQINAILQIILNRISLISDNKPHVRRVQWFLFGCVLLLQVAVACFWVPAQLQISDLYVDINHVFDRTEKVVFALIDLCLNVYFIHLVRSTLIAYGLTKYVLLYRVNIAMILVSMTMDVLIIGMMSLPSAFLYVLFHPLAYLIKLHIELSMAELIAKIVKASSRSRSCLCPCTEADNDILVAPTTGRVSEWGPFRRLRETRAVDQTTATRTVTAEDANVGGGGEVEPVEVHDLGPGADKVVDQLLVAAGAGVHLGQGAELGLRAEDEVEAGGGPLLGARLAVGAHEDVLGVVGGLPLGGHVQQVDEEVVGQDTGAGGEDAVGRAVKVGADGAETADEDGQLRGGELEEVGAVDEGLLLLDAARRAAVVAEAVGDGLEVVEGLDVGLLLGGVGTARDEGHDQIDTSGAGSALYGGGTGEDDEIGQGDALTGGLGLVKGGLDALEDAEDLGQLLGADVATVGTTTLVAATESRGRSPGSRDELGDAETRVEDLALEAQDIPPINEQVVDSRDGVLPDELLLRNLRAQVEDARTHVTVGELEPGAGEGIVELVWVLEEAARDLLVLSIGPESDVGHQHSGGVLLGLVEGVGDDVVGILCDKLWGAARALDELPLVAEQVLEEVVAPPGGSLGPDNLQTRCDGIGALSGLVAVLPAQTVLLDGSTLGFGADMAVGSGAVGLAKGVTTSNQSDGLLVVHGHAAERLADVVGGSDGVGIGVGPAGVDVDQAHVGGSQGLFEALGMCLAVLGLQRGAGGEALVPALGEEAGLGAPVDGLVGLPGVGAAAGETKGLETHGLEGDVAGKDHQVGPGDLVAILLLDGPQQAAGLVEVAVIGPAGERGESLLTLARKKSSGIALSYLATAASAVEDAVGTSRVPGHADEETAVVAEIGWPPILGVGHQGRQVGLEGIVVEALELLGIVKVGAEGIRGNSVLAQDVEAELLGPPVAVLGAAASDVGLGVGALALTHGDEAGAYRAVWGEEKSSWFWSPEVRSGYQSSKERHRQNRKQRRGGRTAVTVQLAGRRSYTDGTIASIQARVGG
ncbi:unnamed protein product [Clonostachys solani]|uniref:Uncharacterized protein n=1 Tax=Clonostachys solani TaxID=160281 RepID=A0A9P0EKN3_9HYPO|nr:unnamed protein product [Clonostachys solani]